MASTGGPTAGRMRVAPADLRQQQIQQQPSSGLLQAKELEGCWICCCFPLLFCALYRKEATGPDSLRHRGCCFPLMLPFEEHRQRVAGTNGFHKVGEPGNVDVHNSESCQCNGLSCGIKLF